MTLTLNRMMTGSDAVLWAIEADPNLRSTVTTVSELDRAPDLDELRRRLRAAIDFYPRLRQRVSEPALRFGHPQWVDVAEFDLDNRMRVLDGHGMNHRQVLDLAARSARAGVDRSQPLWELVVVDRLEGDAAALILKFHHSLTDGVGGVELLLSLLDWTRHPRKQAAPPAPTPWATESSWDHLAAQVGGLARGMDGLSRFLLRSTVHPASAVSNTWRTGESMARLVAPGGGRVSPLFRGHSDRWAFDSHEVPMSVLRQSASAAGGTLNDVFLASVAGGLHRYHQKLGREVSHLRVNLPVSFRTASDPAGGNRFAPVRFVLPVDEPDAAKRIRQIGRVCRKWRSEPALPWTETIADVLSRLPDRVTTALLGSMMYGVDFVATNVPGVPKACYIAGAAVRRQFAFAPLAGAAVNVSLLSHAGTACIGVNLDEAAVSEPEILMDSLKDGFDEVASLAA